MFFFRMKSLPVMLPCYLLYHLIWARIIHIHDAIVYGMPLLDVIEKKEQYKWDLVSYQ